MNCRPSIIVPKLIPQPTWGGEYIATYKSCVDPIITGLKIGQSYELSAESMLTSVTDSAQAPIEIGDASTGATTQVIGDSSSMFSLRSIMGTEPMDILIKFTQAKGNSFQVHIRPGESVGHWKAKPESWYFFEAGKATLGLKHPTTESIAAYKKTCQEILSVMEQLSKDVKAGVKTPGQAKVDAASYIASNSPFQFVNELDVSKGTVIDLSAGGIHHSWEEGESIPDGNIVYEVQLNVMDTDCTLRSFDKGKIGDDGKIRPIHIDDYFAALDTDPTRNDVGRLVRRADGETLFATPYYTTKEVTTLMPHESSFQHVFVKDGVIELAGLTVRKGASVFIPKGFDFSPISGATLIVTSVEDKI